MIQSTEEMRDELETVRAEIRQIYAARDALMNVNKSYRDPTDTARYPVLTALEASLMHRLAAA